MSRRLLLVAACALLATPGSTGLASARVHVGLEGGLNYGKLDQVAGPPLTSGNPSYQGAWSLGAVCEIPLVRQLALTTGARYLEYRYLSASAQLFSGGTGFDFERRTTCRFASLPVLLEAKLRPGHGPFLTGGVEAAYLLGVSDHIALKELMSVVPGSLGARPPTRPAGRIFEELTPADPIERYRRFDLALTAGVGWDFALLEHSALAQLRYHHGLLDVAKSDLLEEKTRGLELLAGWRW